MRRNLAFYDCDTVSIKRKKKKRKGKDEGNKGNEKARQRKQECSRDISTRILSTSIRYTDTSPPLVIIAGRYVIIIGGVLMERA